MHTCRKGLWLCRLDGFSSFAFAGLHPNVSDAWLVFAQPHHIDVEFISQVCTLLPDSIGGIRVARIKEDCLPHFQGWSQLQWAEELVLDWRFECLVLSTQLIFEANGSALSRFRRGKHYIDVNHVTSKVVQPEDELRVKKLFSSWAESVSHQKQFSLENLIEPNLAGLHMALDPRRNVNGVLVSYHDEPIGFYVYEVPPNSRKAAAGVSMAVNRAVRGASEFCYWDMCRHCLELGIEEININGAETESLDSFRKKLHGGMSRRYKIHSFDWVP